jgi:tellurite methyltransferase
MAAGAENPDRELWNACHGEADPAPGPPSEWLELHRELVARRAPGRALDLACGRGRHALLLAELGFEVDALDLSDVAVQLVDSLARERGAAIRAHLVDLAAAPAFPRPPYAAILNLHYLERSIFPLIAQALAPGGILVFEAFTRDHPGVAGRDMPDRFLLAPNELLHAFARHLHVLRYREGPLGGERPRAVASLVACRPTDARAALPCAQHAALT